MVRILSGREASAALLEELQSDVTTYDPHLVVVQIGDDPASSSYIKQKRKSCDKIGMRNTHMHLPADTSKEQLFELVNELNDDPDVSGFFVQLPLPGSLDESAPLIQRAMDPAKDVDGFCAYNLGKMFLSKEYEHLPPATPRGIIALLEYYDIDVGGKDVTIIGRSNTVGKPLSVMLLNRNATVTVCHSQTKDLAYKTRSADVIVAAVGRPQFVTADMVRDGAVVIDVGIHRTDDGLVGDTDFDRLSKKVEAITPVPGGVGPMTVYGLLKNTVEAKKRLVETST